jgi:hypothetical protein
MGARASKRTRIELDQVSGRGDAEEDLAMPNVLGNIITAAAPDPPLGRHNDISISLSNLYLVGRVRLCSVRSTLASNPANRNLYVVAGRLQHGRLAARHSCWPPAREDSH